MISSSHDVITISQWLCAFKAFTLKNKFDWSMFTNIVSDFSYAQMNSLSIGFNGFTSIFDYLNWCYAVLFKNIENVEPKKTIINVCANHYTKIIVGHVHGHFQIDNRVNRKQRVNTIISWICLLFNFTDMSVIELWLNGLR